jgi:SAM-dependent methyltransferase
MPAPRTKDARAQKPAIYWELASWFHLLTHPKSYAGEARFVRQTLLPVRPAAKPTMLELGSGGGNNALHLKKHFDLTLTDVSPGMLALSRKINPECTHVEGDMRRLRLKRQFDFVFVHDAIMYMLSERDLARAMKTVFVHCKPGGVACFSPTLFARRTADARTRRASRRHARAAVRQCRTHCACDIERRTLDDDRRRQYCTRIDRHAFGVFSRATWKQLLSATGFSVRRVADPWRQDCFVARRSG